MNPIVAYFTKSGSFLTPVKRQPAGVIRAVTIPHDLLDHFPDDDGSIEHEIMAIGAMVYNCDGMPLTPNGEGYDVLIETAQNVSGLWGYVESRHQELRPAPESPAVPEIEHIPTGIAHHLEHEYGVEDSEFVAQAMGWVNYGYAQAQLRYADISRADLRDNRNEMYSVIESTMGALPDTDHNELIRVEWDVEHGIFEAKLIQVWQVGVIDKAMVLANPSVLHNYDIGKWWVSNCFEQGKTFYFDWNELSSQADIFGFNLGDALNFPMFNSREEAESAKKEGDRIDRCNWSYGYYIYQEKYVGNELRINYPKRRKALI